MYQISDEYRAKMFDEVQTHRLVGTIDGISFTENDVIGVSYSNQCSEKKVNVGSVFVGVLKLTFLKSFLSRGDYYQKKIIISDGLLLGYDENEQPIWEDIPIGEFYVAEATWRAENMIEVVAYDALSRMDKPCEVDTSNGTVYSFCKWIELMTGVEFGMTEDQVNAMPNGPEFIQAYYENDIVTYRDLLSYLAAFVGGFAYAGRDGKFYLKNFGNFRRIDIAIPKNRRINNAKFSDFVTAYDAISYTYFKTGRVSYFGPGQWTICDLGANPFLQYGSDETLYSRRWNILGAIVPMLYTPFTVSLLPAFIAIDLADVIEFTDDYTEDSTVGGAMQISWSYSRQVTVSCFGDNPDIEKVKSSSSKSISRVTESSVSNEMVYHNFVNTEPITFGPEVETSVAKLRFMASSPTNVLIFHEFIFDVEMDPSLANSYEVRYYYDGELIGYSPYESLAAMGVKTEVDGTEYEGVVEPVNLSICRDFFYMKKGITPGASHEWEVKVISHGIESTTIDVNHCHITLEGQSLYADDVFDGLIQVEDNVELFSFGYIEPLAIKEGTGEEAPKVTFTTPGDYIVTDDNEYIITDDGDRWIL